MNVVPVNDAVLLAGLNAYLHGLHVQERPDIFNVFDAEAVTAYFEGCLVKDSYYHPGVFVDGVLAGFAQAEVMHRPGSAFGQPYVYIHIHQLSVHPSYKRMGIARMLVRAIEVYAAEKGINRIDLTVWDFNEEAIAFYTACGFKQVPRPRIS